MFHVNQQVIYRPRHQDGFVYAVVKRVTLARDDRVRSERQPGAALCQTGLPAECADLPAADLMLDGGKTASQRDRNRQKAIPGILSGIIGVFFGDAEGVLPYDRFPVIPLKTRRYRFIAYRGFESPSLRQRFNQSSPK